ncbi:helix-turn-helix domain-containing protein [Pyramidobacter piscolens]|uniref:Transcriptional regulator, AraC family n=1 Tax=Pyramidobacter piscolens W5455 TaxID=352165 RepID=A0ABM9ZWG6_9BACT|nr:helix-turn-helix domain-containing protein [Pyramidobacter piscolens]EFB91267.1 transcriptional regulator, AraC family [Pyramidobacter piscolens W5455]BDF78861.1 AraC family transcriptional regulator [Pyramidobacter piscolens]
MKYIYTSNAHLWSFPLELYVRDVNFFCFNWHPEYELTILLKGKATLCVDGNVHKIRENDVYLVNSNRGHAVVSEEKESTALVIHFSPEYFTQMESAHTKLEFACISNQTNRDEQRFAALRQYAAQMMLAALFNAPSSRFILRGAFNMLMGTLLSGFPVKQSPMIESPRDRKNLKTIQTVTNWLEKNFDKKVTLDAAAKVARYNRTYFSSFFRRNVGISFYDYLTRIRFRHAMYQLNNTNHSLTDIAADSGFPDLKTFSSYYKKTFHEPPSVHQRAIDMSSFTPARENERIYLDTSASDIGEKLRDFARLDSYVSPSQPKLAPTAPDKFDQIVALCEQLMTIAKQSY